jgi:chaperonin GroES
MSKMPKNTPKNSARSIIPIGDKVLIQEIKSDIKTKMGIILPDSMGNDKGLKEGKVLAVGEGKYIEGELVKLFVEKGDTVLFSWGEEIKVDGKEYFLVRESEISAKIK